MRGQQTDNPKKSNTFTFIDFLKWLFKIHIQYKNVYSMMCGFVRAASLQFKDTI